MVALGSSYAAGPGIRPLSDAVPFHPNAAGMAAIADLLVALLRGGV